MFICSRCKGSDILHKVYVNPNTGKPSDNAIIMSYKDMNWCNTCREALPFDIKKVEKIKPEDCSHNNTTLHHPNIPWQCDDCDSFLVDGKVIK